MIYKTLHKNAQTALNSHGLENDDDVIAFLDNGGELADIKGIGLAMAQRVREAYDQTSLDSSDPAEPKTVWRKRTVAIHNRKAGHGTITRINASKRGRE